MAGFSSARFSVGSDSASDTAGTSSKLLRGDEHDDDPEPIFGPSLPDSMPESVGESSFRLDCAGRVTAVIVVPAGMFG